MTVRDILDTITSIDQTTADILQMQKSLPKQAGERKVLNLAIAYMNEYKALLENYEVNESTDIREKILSINRDR